MMSRSFSLLAEASRTLSRIAPSAHRAVCYQTLETQRANLLHYSLHPHDLCLLLLRLQQGLAPLLDLLQRPLGILLAREEEVLYLSR